MCGTAFILMDPSQLSRAQACSLSAQPGIQICNDGYARPIEEEGCCKTPGCADQLAHHQAQDNRSPTMKPIQAGIIHMSTTEEQFSAASPAALAACMHQRFVLLYAA